MVPERKYIGRSPDSDPTLGLRGPRHDGRSLCHPQEEQTLPRHCQQPLSSGSPCFSSDLICYGVMVFQVLNI